MNKSLLFTAALAGLLASSTNCKDAKSNVSSTPTDGKCYGVNTCKATGECATKEHGCGGMNSCKGKGWLKLTEAACKEKSGKFEAVQDGKFM